MQWARNMTRNEVTLNPEIPPDKPAYIPPDMSWKKQDYAQLEHAKEVAEASKPEDEKSLLDKVLGWIDNHQTATSIGIGVAVGALTVGTVLLAASTAVVTLPVLLTAVAVGAVVAGAEVAIGTALLNRYFGRDLTTNIWSNIGAAAISAATTTGLGLFLFGGGLTSTLVMAGNGAAAFCVNNQTLCSYVEPVRKASISSKKRV